MSKRRQDMLEFAIMLAAEIRAGKGRADGAHDSDYAIAVLSDRLVRAAGRLHRISEDCCNYGREEDDQRFERACNRVSKLLAPYGIKAIFSGDPRGASIKLVLPATKRTNGWDGEGWCVPW